MSEAFIPLINPAGGRIVNLGSGAGPMFVVKQDKAKQDFLGPEKPTWAELETYMKETVGNVDNFGAYGLSKAVMHKYTEISAKENPTLMISVVSPGFVDTALCKGFGAKLTPEEGTKSTIHCLFTDLEASGLYFGSDALRSPLHVTRNPGDPAFTGY